MQGLVLSAAWHNPELETSALVPPSEAGVDPHMYLLPVGVPGRTLIPVIATALPYPWGTV